MSNIVALSVNGILVFGIPEQVPLPPQVYHIGRSGLHLYLLQILPCTA